MIAKIKNIYKFGWEELHTAILLNFLVYLKPWLGKRKRKRKRKRNGGKRKFPLATVSSPQHCHRSLFLKNLKTHTRLRRKKKWKKDTRRSYGSLYSCVCKKEDSESQSWQAPPLAGRPPGLAAGDHEAPRPRAHALRLRLWPPVGAQGPPTPDPWPLAPWLWRPARTYTSSRRCAPPLTFSLSSRPFPSFFSQWNEALITSLNSNLWKSSLWRFAELG